MSQSLQKIPEAETAELSRKKNFVPMIYGTLIVLAIYVLSIGPVAYWESSRNMDDPTSMAVSTIYIPLDALTRVSPLAERFFQWYIRLWVPPHDTTQ